MLNKVRENCYSISVNVRESFTFEFVPSDYRVIIDYYCSTDNYHYISSLDFDNKSPDFSNIAVEFGRIIDNYLNHNVISGSTRRAWLKFKQEIMALYNNYSMASLMLG